MSPALNNGDYVITTKPRSYRPGFIYVIEHIDLGCIIKRLTGQAGDRYLFSGDNPNSTPGAILAPITSDRIIGQVKFVIGKTGIRRSPPLPSRLNEHSGA